MKTEFHGTYSSPIGTLAVQGNGLAISGIRLKAPGVSGKPQRLPAPVRASLDRYFHGRSGRAKVRLSPEGTPFQKKVWKALETIPWGRCVSYADLARRLERPRAVRAVARVVGQNPVAVLIPCHRVIGSDGSLTGYAYGLKKKAWLLRHEQRGAKFL